MKNEDFDIVTVFTITRGMWMSADHEHDDKAEGWYGFYFEEFGTDWSMYPGCWGKLIMETQDCDIAPSVDGRKPAIKEGGWLRLAYQYTAWKMIPAEGSEVRTDQIVDTPEGEISTHMTPIADSEVHSSQSIITARWKMVHSQWFKLPETPGDACVWIEGKADPGKNISLALATLHIGKPKVGVVVPTV
jgi:hypothetical protein